MNAGWSRLPQDGKRVRRSLAARLAALCVLCSASLAAAAVEPPVGIQSTPPRLGLIEGEVLFWRPGDGDWESAELNTPLAPGDALATRDGQLEMQIGGESFVRAGSGTQLRLQSNEPEFFHVELSAGHLAVDLRDLRRGAVQVDTPNATVTIARDGYYRIDVDEASTRVVVRRGGHASVTQAGGSAVAVATGEAVEITGSADGRITALAAPPFDDWDRWNYDRADAYLAAPRSAAVSSEVYGVEELERHGNWRYVNTYGRVWVPDAVPTGWAPYTYGRWRWDPLYGWAWVDYAPWGWAPFHYGRWVYAGYWAWAPGPIIAAPVYSPALVAFFGGPGISVGISVPFVSWVALGWGEPLIPWWGGVGFIGRPCWWGWGGPRVVNNVVINNYGDVFNGDINIYRNRNAPGALVGVPKDQFDTRSLHRARLDGLERASLEPVRGALPVAARGGGALDGGRKAMPDLAGARALDGQAAANSLSRGNRGEGTAANLTRRGDALGAARAGVSSNARPDNATFDSLRQRGTGNAGASGGRNLARSSGTGSDAGSLRRGGVPPAAGGAKGGATTDALRRRDAGGTAGGARADLSRSAPSVPGANNLRRGQAPPPLRDGAKGGAAFDSLRQRGTAPAAGAARVGGANQTAALGSNNLRRGQSPPSLTGNSKAGTSAFDAVRQRGASGGSVGSRPGAAKPSAPSLGSSNVRRSQPAPAPGSSNVRRSQPAPALPNARSKAGSATAPLRRSGGSTVRPSAPPSGSANLRRGAAPSSGSANLRRAAPSSGSAKVRRAAPPAVSRGGSKMGSATAPLQRYRGAAQQPAQVQRRAQSPEVRRAAPSSGSRRVAEARAPQSGGGRTAAPSVRSYSAPSYSRSAPAPSGGARSLSRGGGGGGGSSFSRSAGGGMRSGGGIASAGRSFGMGGGGSRGAMGSGKLGR